MKHGAHRTGLEDVCGNNLSAAFDEPPRTLGELANEVASRSIPFHVNGFAHTKGWLFFVKDFEFLCRDALLNVSGP